MPTAPTPLNHRRRAALAALLVIACPPFLGLAGCGGESEDHKQIRANWKRYFASMQKGAGLDYHDLVTAGTVEHYDRLVRLAVKGTKAEIDALSPAEKSDVMVMRHRVPLAKLRAMDGRAYVIHAAGGKYWADPDVELSDDPDEKGPWDLATIIVTGTTAIADYAVSIEVNERPSGRTRRSDIHVEKSQMFFVKEEGAWRIDEVALLPTINREITASARGTTIEKFLIEAESEDSGKPVRADIFDKPPR